jgi:hypothetical protein
MVIIHMLLCYCVNRVRVLYAGYAAYVYIADVYYLQETEFFGFWMGAILFMKPRIWRKYTSAKMILRICMGE